MPRVLQGDTGYYHISVEIRDLENPANRYREFKVHVNERGSYKTTYYWTSSQTGNWTSYMVTGLTPHTSYTFEVEANWAGTWYPVGWLSDAYTDGPREPSKPTGLGVDRATPNSIMISWDWQNDADYWKCYINDSYDGRIGSTSSYTFTDLSSDTRYRLCVRATNSDGDSEAVCINAYTEPSPRPDNFYWSYSKSSGSSVYQTDMYGGRIRAKILPAWEWNNFIDRINEFRKYKGYSNYSFSRAYSGDKFTLNHLQQARSAISSMTSVPSLRSSSIIYASDFNNLSNSLNSIR